MIALVCSLALAQEGAPPPRPDPAPEPAPAPAPEPAPAPAPAPAAPAPAVAAPAPSAWSPPEVPDRGRHEPPADWFEASVEVGTLRAADDRYELFTSGPRISSWGLRVGARPVPRVAVFADWQRDRSGQLISGGALTAGTSLGTHQLSLGAKADVPLFGDVLRPYVAVAALGVFGTARFDDDVYEPESPGQVSWSAFAPGGLAVGGAELRFVPLDRLALAWHLELGYALVGQLAFDELGPYDVGGMVMRTGIGVRI